MDQINTLASSTSVAVAASENISTIIGTTTSGFLDATPVVQTGVMTATGWHSCWYCYKWRDVTWVCDCYDSTTVITSVTGVSVDGAAGATTAPWADLPALTAEQLQRLIARSRISVIG